MSFTDTTFMTALFREYLPKLFNGHEITGCSIERAPRPIFHKQQAHDPPVFSILYKLDGFQTNTGKTWVQRIYGKTFAPCLSQTASENIHPRMPPHSPQNGTVTHIPEYDLALWVFPHDPTLKQLRTCFDPEKVKLFFPLEVLSSHGMPLHESCEVSIQPLNYLPEDRCTTRYDLQWDQSASPQRVGLVGKTFSDTRGQDLFQLMKQLWSLSSKESEAFKVAQPFLYTESLKTIWSEVLLGTPVNSLLTATNCYAFSAAIAKGLAHLHRSPLTHFATDNTRGALTDSWLKATQLIQALPSLRKPIQAVLSNLEKDSRVSAVLPDTPIHGSFRIKELIMQNGRLGLFDFDNCTRGNPIRDVGTFIADLHRRGSESNLYSLLVRKFLDTYRKQVEWDVPVKAVNWHVRTRLLEKAYWRLENKWFDPDLEKHIYRIVCLAQEENPSWAQA